mgnify:FL=1
MEHQIVEIYDKWTACIVYPSSEYSLSHLEIHLYAKSKIHLQKQVSTKFFSMLMKFFLAFFVWNEKKTTTLY